MNKKYKIQATILLSIGLLLSPALFFIAETLIYSFTTSTTGDEGLALFFYLIIFPLPAFISLLCLIFGVNRLVRARRQPTTLPIRSPQGAILPISIKEYRREKIHLSALTVGTVVLGIIGIAMLVFVIYLLLQATPFDLIFAGAIPIAIVLLAIIFVPINIKNISKQKKIILEQRGIVQPEEL
jgi:hypothetical protein